MSIIVDIVRRMQDGELGSPPGPRGARDSLHDRCREMFGLSKEEVETLLDEAIDRGDIVYWHGNIYAAEDEYIDKAISYEENEADITRDILVRKLEAARD